MQSLIFVYLLIFAHQISAQQCEFPGHYRNGKVLPRKTWYAPGEQVIHTCTTGYYMLHNSQFVRQLQSTCESKGIWSESVPVCDYIDVFRNKTVISGTSGNNTSSMVDEDESTCGKVEFPKNHTSKVPLPLVTLSDVPDSGNIHIIVSLKTLDRVPEGTKMYVFLHLHGTNRHTAFNCDSTKSITIRQSMNTSFSCNLTSETSASQFTTDFQLHFEKSEAKDVPILSICSLKGLVLSKSRVESDDVIHDVVELGLTNYNQSMNCTWKHNVSDPQEFPHKTERILWTVSVCGLTDYWPYICLATGTLAFFITLLYTVTFCYCFRRTRKQSETALHSWIKGKPRLKRDYDTRILQEKQCDPIIMNEKLRDLNENRDYHLYEIPR